MINIRRPLRALQSPLLLEIMPPLHRNLATIKLTPTAMATLISTLLFTVGFPGVTPGKIVKVPESVDGEDKVPDGEREEVYEHPGDVGDAVGSDDDEDAGKTEDEGEENERDDGGLGVGYGGFDAEGDWESVSVEGSGMGNADGMTDRRRL